MDIDAKLAELGLTLPKAAAPVAAYVPAVEVGGLLYVSGQLPFDPEGQLMTGRLDGPADIERGAEGGRTLRADARRADQGGARRLARSGRADRQARRRSSPRAPTSPISPRSLNGASELMVALFGEAGKHARSAVGVPVLPLGAAVEVDAIVALRDA